MKNITITISLILSMVYSTSAQDTSQYKIDTSNINVTHLSVINGDTIPLINIKEYNFNYMHFDNAYDKALYKKKERYAYKVYKYAKDAIRIFYETKEVTADMNKRRHKKKYIKKLQKELKEQFEEPLKNLTRTQGSILVEMIEREMDEPMYDLIKELRGGTTAFFYHNSGKFYGYDLKKPYDKEEDPMLENIFSKIDITYYQKQNQ